MSSVRQQIVAAITTRLGQIAPGKVWALPDGNHVCTSAPKSVTAWRKVGYSLAQVPAVAFWDTGSAPAEAAIGQHGHDLKIEIAGFLAGNSSIDDGRALLADIVAAIGSDPRWAGLARWTDIEQQNVDVAQEGDVIAAVQVVATVTYHTGLWRI